MELTFYCTVCRNPIPEERAKKNGVTCSPECGKTRTALKRELRRGRGICQGCGRPMPKQRATAKMQGCKGESLSVTEARN